MSEAGGSEPRRAPRSRFPARVRLRRRSEFRAVFDSGERVPGRLLVVCVRKGTPEHKVAVVAGRRVGGAVARNRAKRLLREAYRLNRFRLALTCHLALIARAAIVRARRPEVETELLALLAELGCLEGPGAPRPKE